MAGHGGSGKNLLLVRAFGVRCIFFSSSLSPSLLLCCVCVWCGLWRGVGGHGLYATARARVCVRVMFFV